MNFSNSTSTPSFNTLTAESVVPVVVDEQSICTPSDTIEKLTVLITPAIAKRLIEQTDPTMQRRLSRADVGRYAKDMLNNLWAYNHVPIMQDTEGNLFDGQHRLYACVKSGRPFITDMVKGAVYSRAMDTIDTGRNRTKADILTILNHEVKYPVTVSGAIDFIYNMSMGRFADSQTRASKFSNHEIREWMIENESIVSQLSDYAQDIHKVNPLIPYKLSVAFRYIFSKIDPHAGNAFFDQFLRGIGLTEDSPVLFVRNYLQANPDMGYRSKIILMIKAWNDFYTNDGVMRGSYYKTANVRMPEIAGIETVKLYSTPKAWESRKSTTA